MIPRQVIYIGKIMHLRLIPKIHKFQYSFFSLFLDIDVFDKTQCELSIFSVNRFNIFSFYEKDHGLRDGSPLRPWLNSELQRTQMPDADQVFLLCFPRILGYVFNPFSAYFCYSKGVLTTIVYEVKNTFGDQITYIRNTKISDNNVIKHSQTKKMYVSPFIEMDQTYSFMIRPPGDKLSIRISQSGKEGKTLIATQNGEAILLNDTNLLKCMVTHPLMTLKVIIGIHWEAFRLVLKGIKFNRYSPQFENKK
jgi:DUF1365 family protein